MSQLKLSDLEQCWLDGFKAFHQCEDDSVNPHMPGSKQAHYWREGWWEACFNTHNISNIYKKPYPEINLAPPASQRNTPH